MATTLLLADDSPTIAKILKMALANEPYEIRSVLTAEEALTELKKAPPFFFLCDLTLPEKNGYDFARLIKRDSKLRGIRVVLLASAFEPVDEVEYQACGADGLIKKPFDPAELRQSLRKIVDAPAGFPAGSHVTGSLSGFMVSGGDDGTSTDMLSQPPDAPPPSNEDTLSNLLSGTPESPAQEGDADSILAGLLGGDSPESSPERTNLTVGLDLTGQTNTVSTEDVLDISSAFDSASGNTAMIDFAATASDPGPPPKENPHAAPAPAEAPLSANAQALAAFFEAEIQSQPEAPPPAPKAKAPAETDFPQEPPPADSFDASLSSIEWDAGPADASLSGWSSNQPTKAETPPAFPPRTSKTTTGFSPMPSGAPPLSAPKPGSGSGAERGGGPAMFDTGGSSFRFSDDYINRITKAFAGNPDETMPESHHVEHAEPTPFFPQRSDDRPAEAPPRTAPASSPGGGAWSENDVQKIEQIVREEVQMVVREVAEKIAWEVIPELAENLIRKELDRVLKEMGQG